MAMLYFVLTNPTGWFVYYGYIANIIVWFVVAWYRVFPRPGSMGHEAPDTNRS